MLLKVQSDKTQCEATETVPSLILVANSYTNQTVINTLKNGPVYRILKLEKLKQE